MDEYGVHARNLFELAGLDFKTIDAIAIASVVPPLNYTLKTMAETYFQLTPLFIDQTTDTGLEILYEPASDVGVTESSMHRRDRSIVHRALVIWHGHKFNAQ